MCWSAEGSLATWALGMILAVYSKVHATAHPAIWLLGAEFTQMQLIEYFLWKNLDRPDQNAFWSRAGMWLIVAQPLISIWAIQDLQIRRTWWSLYTTALILWLNSTKIDYSTEVAGNGHLKWNWLFQRGSWFNWVWAISLLAPLAYSGHRAAFWFGSLTALVSLYFNMKYQATGSYWCWLVVFGWLGALIKTGGRL